MKNNFKASEHDCKCGCGRNNMSARHMRMLNHAANISEEHAGYNVPYIINSGCRCPAHNKAEGSTSMNHVEGEASDIKYKSNSQLMWIIVGLILAGFRRVGINRKYKFIHADTMDKAESCWGY